MVAHFLTLIHIFANLHRTGSKPVVTIALETSFNIGARTITAYIGHDALIVVWNDQYQN